jgi:hypothetical protein
MRMRSGSNVRSRFSPYLVAPSGLIRMGEFRRVNPGLSYLGTFGPYALAPRDSFGDRMRRAEGGRDNDCGGAVQPRGR